MALDSKQPKGYRKAWNGEAARRDPVLQIMNKCAHFTGMQNDVCRAGVPYTTVSEAATETAPFRFACFKDEAKGLACDHAEFPSREQAEEKHFHRLVRLEHIASARKAIVVHTEGKRGVAGTMPCPICKTGTLGFSVASVNGHVWGRCSTPDCVAWME
jgi:hypothetical protein